MLEHSLAELIPPLESGDRLGRREFERRYQAMPHVKKAELIEGTVYMPSPLRFAEHAEPHALLITWLGVYSASKTAIRLGDNATVRLDTDNEVQPDALLRIEESAGGQSRIDEDGYVAGAPELVAEVAYSSASYDLHDKRKVYRRNGVREYIVWRVYEQSLDWFVLNEKGEYERLVSDAQGMLRSRVFPGLQLAVPALLTGDLAAVLESLKES